MHALVEKINAREAKVAVLGQGYVGLPVAMGASEAGLGVVGIEVDTAKATLLSQGTSYVEDIGDDVLGAALARGYRASADPADLAGFDVAVITVPTPLNEGQPDLAHVESAARMCGEHLREGALVILESTTYPGTTDELVGPILAEASGLEAGSGFLLGYSPERIDPGNARYGLRNTPKVVSGLGPDSLAAVEAFYGAFVDKLVPVANTAEAELVKLLENTFRHVNIALVNELAVFAHNLGVDVWSAIDAAATKPFGFMPFRPGPGVGGHCLPVDPSYLSWRVKRRLGETFRFVELANDVNEHMPNYVARRVQELLNNDRLAVNGAKVLVLGLAYKPGSSDARETPAVPVLDGLLELGADVSVADPHVDPARVRVDPRVTFVDADAENLGAADVVVVVTDHPEFDWTLVTAESKRILDTRNRLRGAGAANVEML